MQKLYIKKTPLTPEIHFSPEENIFTISGTSAPEDVRALYYPVIEWIRIFIDELIKGELKILPAGDPVRFKVDMNYFNSSSAKFLNDIFLELKKINHAQIPLVVEWHYDKEDIDMKEAGVDISMLAGMEFEYIPK
jgi:hypothetical protein